MGAATKALNSPSPRPHPFSLMVRSLGKPDEIQSLNEKDFRDLVVKVFHGEKNAEAQDLVCREAIRRYGARLKALCRCYLGDAHLAEDALQDVFVRFIHHGAAIRSTVGGWLFRVARNVAFKASKRASRRVLTDGLDSLPSWESPLAIETKELAQLVLAEIARLPRRDRELALMCWWLPADGSPEPTTQECAGKCLGMQPARVSKTLKRIAERIQEKLRGRGMVVTAAAVLASVGRASAALSPAEIARVAEVALAAPHRAFLSVTSLVPEGVMSLCQKWVLRFSVMGALAVNTHTTSSGHPRAGDSPRSAAKSSPPTQVKKDEKKDNKPEEKHPGGTLTAPDEIENNKCDVSVEVPDWSVPAVKDRDVWVLIVPAQSPDFFFPQGKALLADVKVNERIVLLGGEDPLAKAEKFSVIVISVEKGAIASDEKLGIAAYKKLTPKVLDSKTVKRSK